MIEIKETGSYFDVDKNGFLVNPASVDKVQDKWRPLVDELVQLYKEYFKDNLVAVYLRGSVAKGEAIEGVSDVDSWCYVDLPKEKINQDKFRSAIKKLENKYFFSEGIEAGVSSIDNSKKDQFWIAQAASLYGKDLLREKFKIGKEIFRHSSFPERVRERLKNYLGQEDTDINRTIICTWLCKQILRSVIELCFERSQKYSRDLYRCWETFSGYYPEKSDELREVLYLALNPISDEKQILEIEEKWTKWIVEEKKRLGY